MHHGRVVQVRGEYMPVVNLEEVFDVPRIETGQGSAIMVVVEAEGQRAALLVDQLLGQQQVVVKNLESNYRRVSDVSGATIMGSLLMKVERSAAAEFSFFLAIPTMFGASAYSLYKHWDELHSSDFMVLTIGFVVLAAFFLRLTRQNITAVGDRVDFTNW